MGRLSGIGDKKLGLYGDDFLAVIHEHESSQQDNADGDLQAQQSVDLYRAGMTIEQVARQQHLSEKVIYHHLALGIAKGTLDLDSVVELNSSELTNIQQVILEHEQATGIALKPVFEALGGAYDYHILRCVRAAMQVAAT